MLKVKNKGIVLKKPVKSVGIAVQLTEKEIKEFDIMYSSFDVNSDI